MEKQVCSICGKKFDSSNFVTEVQKVMDEHKLCYSCWFWRDQYLTDISRGEHNWAIINGHHFTLNPKTDGPFQGFGGANFKIRFKDGIIKFCNNMWHQGEIPKAWKDKFPDNAEFCKNPVMEEWLDNNTK